MRRLWSYLVRAFAPKLVFGLELPAWLGLLARNGLALSPWRLPMAVLANVFAVFNTFLTLICRFVFSREIHDTVFEQDPVFVLGHWRTGTTFLHELLSCDPRLVAPTGYQCFLPGHFLLSESSLLPVLQLIMPRTRPMDDMDLALNKPQEDEYALMGLTGRSTYAAFVFPANGPADHAYLSLQALTPKARGKWLSAWMFFLKSVVRRAGTNRRLVLKSPQHTARVRTILQVFPNAKFVHIVRNPLAVYASTLRTWHAMADAHGLQSADGVAPWLEESVLRTFEEMYACFEVDRTLIPVGNLVELRYEDFVSDPKQQLQQLYDALDIGDFSPAEVAVDARLAQSLDYIASTRSTEVGLAKMIAERWGDYIARYGYAHTVSQASSGDD